jgi:hypothetical protein
VTFCHVPLINQYIKLNKTNEQKEIIMTKKITLKLIDNQSHAYIQISKYDLEGLNIDIKDIGSQYSFYNENNACYYLEQDCDANKLHTQLRLKGYEIFDYKVNHVALNYMNDPIFKRLNNV